MVKLPHFGGKSVVFAIVIVLFAVSAIPAYILLSSSNKSANDTVVKGASTEKPKFVTLEISSEGVTVKTINSSDYLPAKDGQELLEGTSLKTDATGQAQIMFTNGTSTRIDKNSEVALSDYQSAPFNTTLTLSVGRIWSRVAKLLGNETYQTESNKVVAAVRGTSYGHQVLPSGQDNMIVTKGAILSSCANGNQKSVVEANQWGTFDCSKKPPKMGAIDDSVKDDWFKLNDEEDKKVEELYGTETFGDTDSVLGSTSEPYLLPKLQFDSSLNLYYYSPTLKTFDTSYTFSTFLLATPTPTPTSYLRDSSIINSLNTNNLYLATPTPTPISKLYNPDVLKSNTDSLIAPPPPPPSLFVPPSTLQITPPPPPPPPSLYIPPSSIVQPPSYLLPPPPPSYINNLPNICC